MHIYILNMHIFRQSIYFGLKDKLNYLKITLNMAINVPLIWANHGCQIDTFFVKMTQFDVA